MPGASPDIDFSHWNFSVCQSHMAVMMTMVPVVPVNDWRLTRVITMIEA
jgi:hypothetical protein